jgi:hypothetical protein
VAKFCFLNSYGFQENTDKMLKLIGDLRRLLQYGFADAAPWYASQRAAKERQWTCKKRETHYQKRSTRSLTHTMPAILMVLRRKHYCKPLTMDFIG